MEKFYINKKYYYKLVTVADNYPQLFNNIKKHCNQSDLVKMIDCEDDQIFKGIKSGDHYSQSDARKSIYFIRCKFVDTKILDFENNKDKLNSSVLINAPPVIILSDNEKFHDADGNISDILTVGERKKEKCYFKFDDVFEFFKFSIDINGKHQLVKRKETVNLITHKGSSYKINSHYIYFQYEKKKTLFITFDCLIKLLFHYTSKNSDSFNNLYTDILFTAKFGTDEQKVKLIVTKFGVEPDTVRKIVGLSASSISAIYLYALGTVKDLRESLKIPVCYSDVMIVYKYGFTDDICRRGSEHVADFNDLKGVRVSLSLFETIDLDYLSDAERDIKNFFKSKKVHYECIDEFDKSRKELIIIDKSKPKTTVWTDIKKEYAKIGGLYSNTIKALNMRTNETTQKLKDALHEIELLQKEKEYLKDKYENDLKFKEEQFKLKEEQFKLKEEQSNAKFKEEQMNSRLKDEQHKLELFSLKYELLKLKHNIKD
jgi:hypothetical protein